MTDELYETAIDITEPFQMLDMEVVFEITWGKDDYPVGGTPDNIIWREYETVDAYLQKFIIGNYHGSRDTLIQMIGEAEVEAIEDRISQKLLEDL